MFCRQANESGSSNSMERDGAKRCFNFLSQAGLKISIFISDRHISISKWIREIQVSTSHFHDLWHVSNCLCKKLLQASKEKGHKIIKAWIKGIRNHLYWSAMSTEMGFGEMIVAKRKSIMRHVAKKHEDHPDKLFPKCAHDDIEPNQSSDILQHSQNRPTGDRWLKF